MPNGGGHLESLGACPLCGSLGIRTRRRRHRSLLWRCRSCNRAFRTPEVVDYVIPTGDDPRGYVFAASIPEMERRARRPVSVSDIRRRRRRSAPFTVSPAVLGILLVVITLGIVGLLFLRDLRSESVDNPSPVSEPVASPVGVALPLSTRTPTTTSRSTPTPAPTRIAGRAYLYKPISPPMAPAHINWSWEGTKDHFREVVTDFTIHNDVGNWSEQHGYYLILMSNEISETLFYFGLQTDIYDPRTGQGGGKGLIFSRWGTRDLSHARYSETDGWTQSSGHEGDFIGVRRSYDWGTGDYRIRIAPDGLEPDGEWFGLWITDLGTNETTWIGSLKFPLLNDTATMRPYALATIELYGNGAVLPINIPQWHVSVKRPLGDNALPVRGYTIYPYDDSENALMNSDAWYNPSDQKAHLLVGSTTERKSPAGDVSFK